ncbi:MAG: adaptor protein MecA [Bacteroides sp.]|nr:adaptor protein MecA [Eubacterium sp.]MCM1418789.1 adaptor protein MecA [Roseburia sp.]MCM1462446.1 adaptor protein MecA [Bacteroides sp.]
MQYDSLSRHTVKITLSEEELREYSLCAETLSSRTVETKRNLARLLKRMKLFSGYKAERLFLEAFPRADGGCILYVSSLAPNDRSAASLLYPDGGETAEQRCEVLCAVESLSLLIRLCAGLSRFYGEADTRAYALEGGRYCLILSGKKRDADAARRFMNEYGETATDFLRIRSAAERGRLVAGEDAAKKLGELF